MTTTAERIIDTTYGKLQGFEERGVHAFRGIPYGASTAGKQRFKPPLKPEPWAGVRPATEFGPISPQEGALVSGNLGDNRTVGFIPESVQGEDCLVLNLWTPGLDDATRPVMVWLHGRGFAGGAGSEGWYNGANLAKRGDVVVITINHRLNVFGYLNLREIGGEEFAGSGVAGMLDAALALEWVRDNVAAFGGDPSRVTIFGESGGGRKVCTMLAMPTAKGLFHRGIIQSSVTLKAVETARATQYAERLLAHLGIKSTDLARLQNLPFEQVTAAVSEVSRAGGGVLNFAPSLDPDYFPAHPFEPAACPTSIDVPLIVGTNKDEAALFLARDPARRKISEDDLLERAAAFLGDRRDEILGAYRASRPDATPWDLWVGVNTESRRLAANALADRRVAANSAPTFMYFFAWESDFLGGLYKAAHAMEIPFVFDNVADVPMTGERTDRFDLAARMSQSWAAFARAGDPNCDAIPHWPAFDSAKRGTMVFDVPPRAENDPRSAERLAWKGDLSFYR